MRKKVISCILIAGLALSLTACGGKEFGNHEKGVANPDRSQTEFAIMGAQSALSPGYDNNIVLNRFQEDTGIRIEWTIMRESLAEQMNIRIAEEELPDAFLRRCIFHYIDFPDKELMEEIIKTHYPDVEENLMRQAMEIFYDIRGMRDIRKKPSTSELIDWINALQIGGIPADVLRAKMPFLGVVVKKDEDLETVRQHGL